MNLNDWYDTGNQILDMVQDAVERQDFSGLSGQLGSLFGGGAAAQSGGGTATRAGGSYGGYGTNTGTVKRGSGGSSVNGQGDDGYARTLKFKGMLLAVLGYGAAAVFAFLFLIVQAIGYYYWMQVGVTSLCLFVLGIAALLVGTRGSRKWSLAVRYARYSRIIGTRTYCQLIEISSVVGRKEHSVAKDLKEMIKQGLFPHGHIDRKETCFITDDATYRQYLLAQKSYEERQRAEKQERRKKQPKKADAGETRAKEASAEGSAKGTGQNSEYDELVSEGRKYILHIRECNDRIPGEEMTDKLYKLERITARIFAEAEKNPAVAGDLKKMMSYYLPTTAKLLDAYCDLDSQPVQGPNIVNTKKEIEQSIDTINEAFANLLDSLFEDTAWDISSDISVLNAMLAQEGLTGGAFDKNKKKEGE